MSFIICTFVFNVDASDNLNLSAHSCVIIEANSGRVVYGYNIDEKLSMASTTKIMTSLLALENCSLDDEFCVTAEMVSVEGTSMGLVDGDTVTMRTIVYGMLLQSGNDAANVAAYKMAGSLEDFAEMMNFRAAEIGMTNTNFVTPSGLDAQDHYSTAYDMALLGACAIKNSEFAGICSAKTADVTYGNPPYLRKLYNHNKFLLQYDGAFGIKTGYTKKSGRCLVTAVERDGVTLVAVTLNAPDDWNDHKKLYDYAFSKVTAYNLCDDLSGVTLSVVGADNDFVGVEMLKPPVATLFENEIDKIKRQILIKKFEYAPVEKGSVAGSVRYYSGNELVCEVPLTVADDVACETQNDKNGLKYFWLSVWRSVLRFIESL